MIEAAGPQKQEKLLESVESENVIWANALRDKQLHLQRVLAWPKEALSVVGQHLPENILVSFLKPLRSALREHFVSHLRDERKEEFFELLESREVNANQAQAATAYVIQKIRKLIDHKLLLIETFDPMLRIEPEIEKILLKRAKELS